jgi:hypothetical protein
MAHESKEEQIPEDDQGRRTGGGAVVFLDKNDPIKALNELKDALYPDGPAAART